ncbi:MAG: DNA repair protein RecO [Bacteroidetes bacterium]|nr:DNA repair protein RecO [Bacteroidota bacterium]
MRLSDKAIVLQSIKHGDKKFILKLYTNNNGLVTAAVALNKNIRSSNIFPLSLINVELILKQNKEVHQVTEISSYYILSNISNSLPKLSIAQFLNEILIKAIKESATNKHLYEFIESTLTYLNDTETEFINLHLYFLIELTKYFGVEPQNNYALQAPFFDCREGQFSPMALAFPLGLNKEDSFLFSEFLKVNALKSKISNEQRQIILEILLAYYRLHFPGFNTIKSLEVLKEVSSA